jgi:hypothetical protein
MKKRIFTASIVFAIALAQVSAQNITNGLIAYWNMDAASGNQVADQAGTYTATLTANASITSSGKAGGALQMPARQTTVSGSGAQFTASGLSWTPTTFSVAWWLNPASHSDYSNQLGSLSGWGGFVFHTDPYGRYYVGTDVATRIFSGNSTAPETADLNQWQHFAFTFEPTTATTGVGKLYKNGRVIFTAFAMSRPAAWNGFYIGSTDPKGTLDGKIDEVRIYNRVLNETDIFRLMIYPYVPKATAWSSAPVSSEWNNAANWQGGVPASYDDVTVNACTQCPVLPASQVFGNVSLNSGSALNIGPYTLEAARTMTISNTNILSNGGTVKTNLVGLSGSRFFGPLTLQVTSFSGSTAIGSGNIFYDPLTLTHGALTPYPGPNIYAILDIATGNEFKGATTINDYTFGMRLGQGGGLNYFRQNVTLNFITNSDWLMAVSNCVFDGELLANNAGGGVMTLSGGNLFKQKVTLNNQQPTGLVTYLTYGNAIYVSDCATCVNTFEKQVEVTNTSQRVEWYKPVDVQFGTYGGKSVFSTPDAVLTIGTAGFRRGNLIVQGCEFSTTQAQNWLLSSAAPETYTSTLQLGARNIFAGNLTAKAPRLKLFGGVYNGDVHLTKTGAGNDSGNGGGLFKTKLTIVNQTTSTIQMATTADDVIQAPQ